MNRETARATQSTNALKLTRNYFLEVIQRRQEAPWTRCRKGLLDVETELFARGELQEWECQAMLKSFLLPSDKLPSDLRKFRELPEGGGGKYKVQNGIREYYRTYEAMDDFELKHAELIPTFEFA